MSTTFSPVVSEMPSLQQRPRISEVLFQGGDQTFASLAVIPSNVRAVESAIRFANGINPFVALVGPSGWGKSHMLFAAAKQFRFELRRLPIPVVSAADWHVDSRLRSIEGPLILDNAQDLISKTRSRLQLQITLERRVRAGKPTMLSFTESKMTRAIRQSLPDFRQWVVAVLKPPTPSERQKVVQRISESENMSISDSLVNVMATKLEGNGRTFLGALKRLRLIQNDWSDDASTLRACGVMNLFLCANSGWDLREQIAELAKHLDEHDQGQVSSFDLAVYVMLRVANLPESEVAGFFRIAPAKAYAYANRFQTLVDSNVEASESLHRFVRRIVAQLSN